MSQGYSHTPDVLPRPGWQSPGPLELKIAALVLIGMMLELMEAAVLIFT